MKLAIHDNGRLGVVSEDGHSIHDVTEALPWPYEANPLGNGWWVRMCDQWAQLEPAIRKAQSSSEPRPITDVTLEAPVLNPPKLLACAVNYAGHEEEMHDIQERVGGTTDKWILQFDVFLKATSSIIGPKDAVVIPEGLDVDREIHHECELAFIIGKGGSHIEASSALDHVFGYTVALDMTLRGEGDRSRRKSYDTFTPLGPWVVTSDEVPNPHELEIHLDVNGRRRQAVNTAEMLHDLPEIISYASSVMSLSPGDVVLTGAPPGVGPVAAGDVMNAEISKIGRLVIPVRSWLG